MLCYMDEPCNNIRNCKPAGSQMMSMKFHNHPLVKLIGLPIQMSTKHIIIIFPVDVCIYSNEEDEMQPWWKASLCLSAGSTLKEPPWVWLTSGLCAVTIRSGWYRWAGANCASCLFSWNGWRAKQTQLQVCPMDHLDLNCFQIIETVLLRRLEKNGISWLCKTFVFWYKNACQLSNINSQIVFSSTLVLTK